MGFKSKLGLLICMVMILSIFTPTVMGVKESRSETKSEYRHHAINGFQNSNIHSELLDLIEKGDNAELGIIVVVKKDKDKSDVEKAIKKADGKKINYHKLANAYSATVKAKKVKDIAEYPNVDKIYNDFRVNAYIHESVPLIGANTLWSSYNGSGITVAVIDTGIDSNHPDLKNKVVDQVSFIAGETPDDGFGHGTHVAGIIAGSGAASGGNYTGVAPQASLMNVKVLDNHGWGSASSVMSGIEYAVDNGADIISMSLGAGIWPPDGTDPVAMTANAAVDAGVVVIASAGNSEAPFCIGSPATGEKVIAVGATTKQDGIALYSSAGPTWDHRIKPEIVAPGGAAFIYSDPAALGIVSAKASGSILDMWYSEYAVGKYYMALSGTSMAAPHVSGVAALMLQAHPDWTPEQIRQQLMNTGVDVGYDPITQGAGRINAISAVEQTLKISPASFCYVTRPGKYSKEVLEISNTGTETMEVYLSTTGDVDVKFSKETITIRKGQTKKVKIEVGMPAGLSSGIHSGRIVANGNGQSASVPILMDAPLTFVGGSSQFSDVIHLPTSEDYKRGTNYYYFEVPVGTPGITSTMSFNEVPGWVDLYLLDPEGEFVDYDFGWESMTERTVSTTNPMPGRWMLLVDSFVFDPMMENIHFTMNTQLHSLAVEPASWMSPVVMSNNALVDQAFTVTNMGESGIPVQVEGYITLPNGSASGIFSGSVDYEEWLPVPPPPPPVPVPPETAEPIEPGYGLHTFDIPDDGSAFTLTMTALNNSAVLGADIFDPDGRWVDWVIFGLWEPSTASVNIEDPKSGTWSVEVWPLAAEASTTEHYLGTYDVMSKNTSLLVNDPESFFVPADTQEVFSSMFSSPGANGDYTGEITVSGNMEVINIPVSVSIGDEVTNPGDFMNTVSNKCWRYYLVDVTSGQLNAILTWDNPDSDIDLFAFDPSGVSVASSTQSGTLSETLNVANAVPGTWTIGVYGYSVSGVQPFSGTVS